EDFDLRIPELLEAMEEVDLLMISADHGNDPTFTGTEHTREYVPLLVYSIKMKEQGALPQGYYSDISAPIAENFSVS
ncbi:phosphopentomutase, partial [Enterococcus faecium]